MSTGLPSLVPETATTRITVAGPLRHRCPHVQELDEGTVTISWTCAGSTLELHSLAGYLAGFATERISHEQLTQAIREDLAGLYGIGGVTVASSWRTAGLGVEVTA